MNPRVTAVTPLEHHQLLIEFNNGEQRSLDVAPYLAYAVFAPLSERRLFNSVRADHGTVSWPGGIDIDPDSVYLDSAPVGLGATA
jgi:hypothetical protein